MEKMKRRITTTRKYTSPCALTILHQIDTRLMGRTKDIPGTTIRLSTVNQGRMTCTTRVTIHHKTWHRADDTNTLQPPSQLHMRNLWNGHRRSPREWEKKENEKQWSENKIKREEDKMHLKRERETLNNKNAMTKRDGEMMQDKNAVLMIVQQL